MVGLNTLRHVHYLLGDLPQALAVRHLTRRCGNARFGTGPRREKK
jgi:hypothetical protein